MFTSAVHLAYFHFIHVICVDDDDDDDDDEGRLVDGGACVSLCLRHWMRVDFSDGSTLVTELFKPTPPLSQREQLPCNLVNPATTTTTTRKLD